jgi:hypothetical protein
MIELTALALLFKITSIGYEPIISTRSVCADVDSLHELLADPANYRGNVTVRPPTRREVVVVFAHTGRGRVVRYTWILTPGRGTTEVDLIAQLESRGAALRALMLLGGRGALTRRAEKMLAELARSTATAAENVVEFPAPARVALHDAA